METVSYVALTQTLFAIILLASKRPKWIQDRILIVMLAVIAWIIIGSLFRSANVGNGFFTNFNLAPFTIALMPLLYLYVRTSINENPRFRKQDRRDSFPISQDHSGKSNRRLNKASS